MPSENSKSHPLNEQDYAIPAQNWQQPAMSQTSPAIIINHIAGDELKKPRLLQGGKDIAFSLIPLVIFCIFIAVLSGNLGMQFGPMRKTDAIPPYRVDLAASAAAKEFHMSFRFPQLPQNWKPNSGSKAIIDNKIIQNLGWVTDTDGYIQVSETGATLDALTKYLSEKNSLYIKNPLLPKSTPGWTWYIREDRRIIGVKKYPDINIGLTGNASVESFYFMSQQLDHGEILQ